MTARFPGLVIRGWRTRVVHDHPRLFPNTRLVQTANGPDLSCSGWPDVPDGWRAIIETACKRLQTAVADEPQAELAISDMKEKFGGLRLDVSCLDLGAAAQEAVSLAVDLAEARSTHICDVCGRRGRWSVRGGWYATRCEEHADGYAPVQGRNLDLQVITRFAGGEPVSTARRYDSNTDTFVPAPVPDDQE
jgi:hypothetical protein